MKTSIAVLPGLLSAVLLSAPEAAAVDKKVCASKYTEAQEQRAEGKLRTARDALLVCSQKDCAGFIRKDCGRWLAEVEEALPSIVVAAKDASGADVTDVRVTMDGERIASELGARAIEVDPGEHTFTFERDGRTVEQKVLVREGEKSRRIEVTFEEEAPEPVAAPATRAATPEDAGTEPEGDGPPMAAWILGGVGVAGLATFAIMGSSGLSEKSDLEDSCSPNCSDDDLSGPRKSFLIADIGLGVGLVSLGIATYLFLDAGSSSGEETARTRTVDVGVAPTRNGGYATVHGRF